MTNFLFCGPGARVERCDVLLVGLTLTERGRPRTAISEWSVAARGRETCPVLLREAVRSNSLSGFLLFAQVEHGERRRTRVVVQLRRTTHCRAGRFS